MCDDKSDESPADTDRAAEKLADHACPNCGGALPAEDSDRLCPACRSIKGTFSELSIEWECLRKYGEQHGQRRDRLGRFQEWPAIQELSCGLFRHTEFTESTWERLEAWLLTRHARDDREVMLTMQRTEIVRLLRTAVEADEKDAQPACGEYTGRLASQGKSEFSDEPPSDSPFRCGPLEGKLKDLARWMGMDQRTLKAHHRKASWWLKRVHGSQWLLWLSTQKKLAEVNGKRLAESAQNDTE
jgi:rubrerythrin